MNSFKIRDGYPICHCDTEIVMPLFLLFLAVPLIEIALFIVIGGEIGIFATLAMVLLTAIVGSALLRWQGVRTLNRIRTELEHRRLPARPIADGAMIAIAGLLLLTPGFFTDFCGFLLFVPSVRTAIWTFVSQRITIVSPESGTRGGADDGVTIDLDETQFQTKPGGDSPWRTNPEN